MTHDMEKLLHDHGYNTYSLLLMAMYLEYECVIISTQIMGSNCSIMP